MNYNNLGRSVLSVSEISMGCMSLKSDSKDASYIIHQAVDMGINFFDTADLYEQGSNETLLGNALGTKRKDIILATKVGNQWNEAGTSWTWNPRKTYILSAVENSLKRLKTDYIDLYQLHGGTIDDPIDEVIETFEILKSQGKIREYGISSIRPNVIREYVKRSNIVSVMMQYSLLDRRPEETCLDLLKANDISVITRGTLAKGLLINKASKSYLEYSADEVQKASEAIREIAKKSGHSKSAVACQYVLHSATVDSAVIGFRTLEQLNDIFEGAGFSRLDQQDYAFLQSNTPALTYKNHR